MDQRVNIQYSIDIEELPNEVQRLLQKSVDTLKEVCTVDLKALSSFDNKSLFSVGSIETIDETRRKLASIDHVLNDVSNIVDGFIKYKTSPSPEENVSESPPVFQYPEAPNSTTLEDLKSQISDFKKAATTS